LTKFWFHDTIEIGNKNKLGGNMINILTGAGSSREEACQDIRDKVITGWILTHAIHVVLDIRDGF